MGALEQLEGWLTEGVPPPAARLPSPTGRADGGGTASRMLDELLAPPIAADHARGNEPDPGFENDTSEPFAVRRSTNPPSGPYGFNPGWLTGSLQPGADDQYPQGEFAPGVHEITSAPGGPAEWVRRNPQEAADLLLQAIGTGVGIFAGTAGGPPGQALMGSLGNVAGRAVSRGIGGAITGTENPPTLGEVGVDAVLGAAGPAVSTAVGPVLRGGLRAVTGTAGSRGERFLRTQAESLNEARLLANVPADADRALAAGALDANTHRNVMGAFGGSAQEAARLSRQAADRAARVAERSARGPAGNTTLAATVASAVDLINSGNFGRAVTILTAGTAISAGQRRGAEWALRQPWAVNFLRNRGPGLSTQNQIIGSLLAEAMAAGVIPDTEPDQTIGRSRRSDAPNPFRNLVSTDWGTRDLITGRFTAEDAG